VRQYAPTVRGADGSTAKMASVSEESERIQKLAERVASAKEYL
jgi:hypothetical protein